MENKNNQVVSEEILFTAEEVKELEEARKRPITFDPECPETTPERALKFRRVNRPSSIVGK